jgi:hypothetical protein
VAALSRALCLVGEAAGCPDITVAAQQATRPRLKVVPSDRYRPLTAAAVLLVAAIAAVVSYLQVATLGLRYGQPPLAAHVMSSSPGWDVPRPVPDRPAAGSRKM